MAISTIVTGGYGNGVFTTDIAQVTLSGYSINPVVLTKTSRASYGESVRRYYQNESVRRYYQSDSTNRKMNRG